MVRVGPPLVDGGSGFTAGVAEVRERERERDAFEVNPTGEGEWRMVNSEEVGEK